MVLKEATGQSQSPLLKLNSLLLQLVLAIWLRRMLEKLDHIPVGATVVYYDNSSTIKLTRNPVLHGRSKHIDVRFQFLHDLSKDGTAMSHHCHTKEKVADIMTKPLIRVVFENLPCCLVSVKILKFYLKTTPSGGNVEKDLVAIFMIQVLYIRSLI